jgi:hypothetical protein
MSNISQYMQKAMLDWSLGGATPTRPAVWGAGLALGNPTSVAGSEIGTGSGYARQTASMSAASTPASSAVTSNLNAMTFGPFSNAQSISGLQVWDTLAATIGNMLWYGPLSVARTVSANDSLIIAPGALTITLN